MVEAVGHHAAPLEAAVDALAEHGTVLAFGVPDQTHYAFPFRAFFRKHGTLIAGAATDRAQALASPASTCASTPRCWSPTSPTSFDVHDAQAAFETATTRPRGRLKVALRV